LPIAQKNHREIISICLDFYHKLRTVKENQHDQFSQLRNETISLIQGFLGVKDELAWEDILDVLITPALYLNKPFDDIKDEEFVEFVKKRLLSEKGYHMYFPLYGVCDFPDGYKLGHATLYIYYSIPEPVQKYFDSEWKFQFEKSRQQVTLEKYLEEKHVTSFLHVSVKAHGSRKAGQKATELADESVHILRSIYDRDFLVSDYAYITEGEKYTGGLSRGKIGWIAYSNRLDAIISKLTNILTKRDPSDIENRLINAIRLFGVGTEATRPEVRYTLLTTGLEGLLMVQNDRDYLGLKLSEKVTFLLEKEPEKRAKLFKVIKDAYARRSDFVHQNPDYEPITDEDVRELRNIFIKVFNKLLELRDDGYTQIQKREGAKTVDRLVEDLKFS